MTTPTGSITLAIDAAARLIAACPAFQSWVDAANATEALESIFAFGFEIDDRIFPSCRLDFGPNDGLQSISGGGPFTYTRQGEIAAVFEDSILHSCAITQAAGTATLTMVGHGFEAGDLIFVQKATQQGYNGEHEVLTAPTADTLTFAVDASTVSPATGDVVAGPPLSDFRQCAYRFSNLLGAVVDDMMLYSGTGTLLCVTTIRIQNIARTGESEGNTRTHYYQGVIMLEFGP